MGPWGIPPGVPFRKRGEGVHRAAIESRRPRELRAMQRR